MSHKLPTCLDASGGTFPLRYQFAQDGDSNSQISMAKFLLNEKSDSVNSSFENDRFAIHWLLRAAESGNRRAFPLIKQCYESGRGITPLNKPSVQACLEQSEEDIIACKVGHNIFRKIMSDSEDGVTEATFAKKVDSLFSEKEVLSDPDLLDEDSVFDFEPVKSSPQEPEINSASEDFRRVSVTDIIFSVKQCLEGNLPLVSLKNAVQNEDYNKWFSWRYADALKNTLCRSLEVLIRELGSAIPPCMLLICMLLCLIWSYVDGNNKYNYIASEYNVYLGTVFVLLVMLSCSCYIITLHLGYYNINKWLDLIKLFEPATKSGEAKQRYVSQTAFPLFVFIPASVIYNFLQPIHPMKLFAGELFLLSILLFVLVDRTIANRRYYVNISLILNGLLCLQKLNFFKVFYFAHFLNFDIHFAISEHFEIHMNWLSCVTLPFVLPYLYFSMLRGDQSQGWLQTLFPHLMCLSWLNVACDFAASCSITDVLVGVGFWLVVLISLSIFGSIINVAFLSMIKIFYVQSYYFGTIFSSVLPSIVIIYYTSSCFVNKSKHVLGRITALVLFSILAITLLYTALPTTSTTETTEAVLSWNQYETSCHRNSWYQTNVADTEIECLPLKGKLISLDGTVTQIELLRHRNFMLYVTNLLPSFLSQWFTCRFGQPMCSIESLTTMSALQKERCRLFEKLKLDQCHLHNWDVYQFRILLEVSSRVSPEIAVIVDHRCSSFIRKLSDGDSLHVVGILNGYEKSTVPEILLKEARCSSCYDRPESCKMNSSNSSIDFDASWHQLTLSYLYPFIHYLP